MPPDILDRLRSDDPGTRIRALQFLGRSPDVRPQVMTELERLVEDRTCGMLDVPYRYGEIRTLAAEALAVARAKIGDLRLVRIEAVPPGLTTDRMAPYSDQAGLPRLGGPRPLERYILLRDGGHLPLRDYEFDPREYLDHDAQPGDAARRLTVTFNAAGAPDAPYQERIELADDGDIHYVRWRGDHRVERHVRAHASVAQAMFAALEQSGFPAVPEHNVPPGASLMEIRLNEAQQTRSAYVDLYKGMSFLGYGEILRRMNDWARWLRDPAATPNADFIA
jgi:hypothetical protein